MSPVTIKLVMGGPYREPAKEPPFYHYGHGMAANVRYVNTSLRFCACGAVIDEQYREVKTVPMKELPNAR